MVIVERNQEKQTSTFVFGVVENVSTGKNATYPLQKKSTRLCSYKSSAGTVLMNLYFLQGFVEVLNNFYLMIFYAITY
jgi:hypothetical protein